ncbi:putative uncharacterized protein DDB_G0289263 [Abrus precatorius]|uniref:Uncharacterized protein n=1 Tax=Abrus precatorius TaxID=3816 RepID=A0A8B8JZC9_ABRPR|nr:putative uncharacterized protein DDB_G0289263 [Abrus precatorius]
MRIRKNAKLSPLLFSSSLRGGSVPVERFQTHVCQLNQSPWDVIPFHSDSIQLEPDDTFTAANNASAGDSFGAVQSAGSMMDSDDKVKLEETMTMVADNNHDNCKTRNSCCCRNEGKQAQSFCEHHSTLLRSYNSSNSSGYANKKAVTAGNRRVKTRSAKKPPSSNPYEFYYYSGFGPLWGKRRGDRNGEGSKNSVGGGENSTMVESEDVVDAPSDVVDDNNNSNNNDNNVCASEMDNGEFDYVDDDEEEDVNEDDGGKKRMRKPVKARSLKSLM